MNKKQSILLVSIGGFLFLFTLIMIYMDFFMDKIGVLGVETRHWTTYSTYVSAILCSSLFFIIGVSAFRKFK